MSWVGLVSGPDQFIFQWLSQLGKKTAILGKIVKRKQRNPVKLDRARKVRYLLLQIGTRLCLHPNLRF